MSNKEKLMDALEPWIGKDVGMFYNAYSALEISKDVFDGKIDKDTTKNAVLDFARVSAFVAGADGLSETEKSLLIKGQVIWSDYSLSWNELEQVVDEASAMSLKEAVEVCKKIAVDIGYQDDHTIDGEHSYIIPTLYYALVVSASDGLTEQEMDRFKQLCRAVHVRKEKVDQIVRVFNLEREATRQMRKLMGVSKL